MLLQRGGAFVLTAILILHAQHGLTFGQQILLDVTNSRAAAPIAAVRRTAIDARSFHRPLDPGRIRKWLELTSACTIAEFELFLAPLSPEEQRLVDKLETIKAPIVNRLSVTNLRRVLNNGGLISLYEEEKLTGRDLTHHTPAVENVLYGAYDCVFASVAPPDGTPSYGDVIIRLKDSVRENGWATPFSGMHFMFAIRDKDARKMQDLLAAGKPLPTEEQNPLSIGFDDRLHFSHYIVTEKYWNRALAYQAVLVLRNAPQTSAGNRIRQRFNELLAEDDDTKFWQLFIPAREPMASAEEAAAREPFGYLEGKFPDRISIDEFTSIEVPLEQLEEVQSWPEAQPHLKLIRAKPKGVP